jgi:hypothetical protein
MSCAATPPCSRTHPAAMTRYSGCATSTGGAAPRYRSASRIAQAAKCPALNLDRPIRHNAISPRQASAGAAATLGASFNRKIDRLRPSGATQPGSVTRSGHDPPKMYPFRPPPHPRPDRWRCPRSASRARSGQGRGRRLAAISVPFEAATPARSGSRLPWPAYAPPPTAGRPLRLRVRHRHGTPGRHWLLRPGIPSARPR